VTTKQTVGIPFARDDHGRRFGRSAIDREPQPFARPMYCDGCGTRIRAVPTHPVSTRAGVIVRTSHYGLLGGGEHRPGCRYDFERQAHHLVIECRGRVTKQGEEYRLLLPDDGGPEHAVPVDDGPSRPGSGVRSVVRRADRVILGEALASARRIARLLHHFDQDPAAVERFRAEYHGQVIPWPQFFYASTRTAELVERLAAGGVSHPVAVSGEVRRHGTATSGSSFYIADRPVPAVLAGCSVRVEATLWTRDRAVYEDLVKAGSWLGFGRWELFPRRSPAPRWVQLWVDGAWNYTADRIRAPWLHPAAAPPAQSRDDRPSQSATSQLSDAKGMGRRGIESG
jgi:hypothetical protein